MNMLTNKNERLALLSATVLFGIIAIVQLWRGFSGMSMAVDGHSVPQWISLLLGLVALGMAVWMGAVLKRRRPLI